MKKLFTLLVLIVTISINAQAPQGFNYQATVRNNSGQLLLNQNVLVKFNVLKNSSTGTVVYSENQTANTDELGHIFLVVGQGTPTKGTLSTINWASGTYYLGIELNTGTGYVDMGTTQLLSVPYALYANSAGNSQAATPNLGAVLTVSNSANNTKIINLQNPTNAQDAATKSYIDSQLQTQIANLQAQISAKQGLPSGGTEGQGLTLCDGLPTWTTNGICPGKITTLNCVGVSVNGSLTEGVASSNVSFMISYTGGNGRSYSAQSISSTGVGGLTSTIQAGTFVNGNGSLKFTVSGTPKSIGNAIFSLNIGGQLCSVQLSVTQSSFITVKTTVNDIMQSPFVCGGSISALNEKVVERGILYGKSINLDYNSATTVGTFQYGLSQGGAISNLATGKITSLDGVGEFKVNIMYLFENTIYYYCAYAKTESGKMVKGETFEISTRNFKRDSRAPDFANVFWKTNFNLFDLLTDELIQPDANGIYKFYYSSNENPIVTYKELTASQLPNFLFYKFKTRDNCLKWTEIKKGIIKP